MREAANPLDPDALTLGFAGCMSRFGSRPVDLWTTLHTLPTTHRHNPNRSGQLMRYEDRST
jgi:hypothetical protein